MTLVGPVTLNYLAVDLLRLTEAEDAYEIFGGGVLEADVLCTSMFWDVWNLTCLGDIHAWPHARLEAYGGAPDWARSFTSRVPLHLNGMSYMYGFSYDGDDVFSIRQWPEWLRGS